MYHLLHLFKLIVSAMKADSITKDFMFIQSDHTLTIRSMLSVFGVLIYGFILIMVIEINPWTYPEFCRRGIKFNIAWKAEGNRLDIRVEGGSKAHPSIPPTPEITLPFFVKQNACMYAPSTSTVDTSILNACVNINSDHSMCCFSLLFQHWYLY